MITRAEAEPRAKGRVREKLATCARDWTGRMVAVFACAVGYSFSNLF